MNAARTSLLLLAGLAVVALADCTTTTLVVPAGDDFAPDTADTADVPDMNDDVVGFYEPLSPYGDWWWSPRFGWVYSPYVDAGWRPYTYGHWVLTGDGWLWASREPFGWACFHYGRWVWLDDAGWVWIPRRAWAPAWVSWRAGGGYYGWAPLGPPGVVVVPFFWVFVVERDFTHDDIDRVAVVPARNPAVLPSSRVIHRPEQRDVERATARPVPVMRVVETPDDARGLGDVVVTPRVKPRPTRDDNDDNGGVDGQGTGAGGDARRTNDGGARALPPRATVVRPLAAPDDAAIDRRYDDERKRLLERRIDASNINDDDARALRQLEEDKAREKKALDAKRTKKVPAKPKAKAKAPAKLVPAPAHPK